MGTSAILAPLGPPKNRTAEVVERLAAEIGSGRLSPGARLPTEQEMMTALGVSRTVVREAVAALRAQGLVTTRQGLGAFVASDQQRRPAAGRYAATATSTPTKTISTTPSGGEASRTSSATKSGTRKRTSHPLP